MRLLSTLLAVLLVCGCTSQTIYVCHDGSAVFDKSECPPLDNDQTGIVSTPSSTNPPAPPDHDSLFDGGGVDLSET
ncbi:MAG: hypothetical protein GF416_07390 [Candidatus Altiarchaeales archaeon]|nr:hypothetical protein [Candidatus Altiarchaeales archaeon]MBD3416936.1 hypothetical protein [Candidatus Altiarchaeales archaeon]